MAPFTKTRVFISYSRESPEHDATVLALATRLARCGLSVSLDRFVAVPSEGWPHWIERNLLAADTVIVVCTATYRRRYEYVATGDARHRPGGVTWEGTLVRNLLYNRSGTRIIPVLLDEPPGIVEHVPLSLLQESRVIIPPSAILATAVPWADEHPSILKLVQLATSHPDITPTTPPPSYPVPAIASDGAPNAPDENHALAIQRIFEHLGHAHERIGSLEERNRARRIRRSAIGLCFLVILPALARLYQVSDSQFAVSVTCSQQIPNNGRFAPWAVEGEPSPKSLASWINLAVDRRAAGIHLPVHVAALLVEDSDLRAALVRANTATPRTIVTADFRNDALKPTIPACPSMAGCVDHYIRSFEPSGNARFRVGGQRREGHPFAAWPCEGTDHNATAPFALANLSRGTPVGDCSAPAWQSRLSVSANAGPDAVLLNMSAPLDGVWLVVQTSDDVPSSQSDPCGGSVELSAASRIARLARLALSLSENK